MNDTTIIPAQLGFFVLEPFNNDADQYAGFNRYPVLAWKVCEYQQSSGAFTISTPVIPANELDDWDISHMPLEMPNGTVLQYKGASEQWFGSAQEWFSTVSEGVI